MNKKIHKSVIIIFFTCLVVFLFFSIRSKQQFQMDSGYRPVMGTFARIVAVAKDANSAKKCIESALAEINKVDELMSDYKDDSEISLVNKDAFNQPVKVSESTFEVLQKSIEFSKLSDGAFDITVGPLVDLWHRAGEANAVPAEDELQQARSKVGYEKLILDASEMTVKFAVDGMRIDLGGIAKGYAVDKAVQAIQNCGAIGAMVSIGGDIRCFGTPSGGKNSWLIGLQNPNENFEFPVGTGAPLLVLKLKDSAVSTSGHYWRFEQIQGKKYSHIIDTKSGYSSDKLASVTIIAKDATANDALATAVTILGAEKGLALIEKLPQTEAILITAQNKIIKTPNAEKYIK